jgi:hypothetical protein
MRERSEKRVCKSRQGPKVGNSWSMSERDSAERADMTKYRRKKQLQNEVQ